MKIRLHFPPRLRRQFRAAAVESFPRETYAILLGHETKHVEFVEIEAKELWMPDRSRHSTRYLKILPDWYEDAKHHAFEAGLEIVGDIHSHPFTAKELEHGLVDCSRSEGDLDHFLWNKPCGIWLLRQTKSGRLISRFRFWAPAPPLELLP